MEPSEDAPIVRDMAQLCLLLLGAALATDAAAAPVAAFLGSAAERVLFISGTETRTQRNEEREEKQ